MSSLPRFVVVEVVGFGWLKYLNENEVACVGDGDGVLEPFSKIEVERSRTNHDYFHLRFCQTNRYWALGENRWLVANSTEQEEDTSEPSCTLFYYVEGGFQHVQSGGFVNIDETGDSCAYLDYSESRDDSPCLTPLDWSLLVKLPKHVAFRGDNEMYLRAIEIEGYPYLQFSGEDPNEDSCGFEIHPMPDGRVGIKSDYYDKFCRLSPCWIWADSDEAGTDNPDTLFRPVGLHDNIIALQSEGNKNYCRRLSADYKDDCLNAAASSTMRKTRLAVEELLEERNVYRLEYDMDSARIYDEQPFVAGTATAINNGNQEATIDVEIKYEESRSHSFSSSVSITGGVSATFKAGLPSILEGGVVASVSVGGTFLWNDTTTTTKPVTVKGSVTVPAWGSAVVSYVGTTGTCDVPFSYIQDDKSSTDGKITTIEQTDGIFTGVNSYNFRFLFD